MTCQLYSRLPPWSQTDQPGAFFAREPDWTYPDKDSLSPPILSPAAIVAAAKSPSRVQMRGQNPIAYVLNAHILSSAPNRRNNFASNCPRVMDRMVGLGSCLARCGLQGFGKRNAFQYSSQGHLLWCPRTRLNFLRPNLFTT
jgi:hypothetical protein